jgi:uncharacterized protein YqjF (DUF2071 family)
MRTTIGRALDLLAAPVQHERVTLVRDHRPWPLPRRPWVMAQTWVDLLFAHWRVPAESLRAAVPGRLELETFDGSAWLGVTPFEVRNLRLRVTPPVPFASTFPEVNVRTYVTYGGRPGIWFFSLDAASSLAVAAARRSYRLPYFRARMAIDREGERVRFRTMRSDAGAPAWAELRATYEPAGDPVPPAPGSLEHWLTERYCLYTLDERGRVLLAQIHHPPWPLQPARAAVEANTMAAEVGLELAERPLVHYARRQDVVFWPLERS